MNIYIYTYIYIYIYNYICSESATERERERGERECVCIVYIIYIHIHIHVHVYTQTYINSHVLTQLLLPVQIHLPLQCQKRPITMSKETYYSVKRDHLLTQLLLPVQIHLLNHALRFFELLFQPLYLYVFTQYKLINIS